MENYRYWKTILVVLAVLSLYSCDKQNKKVKTPTIDGNYIGVLYTRTSISFTGDTFYDTISNAFILNILSNENGILISSVDEELNHVNLKERFNDGSDTLNGNDRVFFNNYVEEKDRAYYLYYNQVNSNDSVSLNSFHPPMGGWNKSLNFHGMKQ